MVTLYINKENKLFLHIDRGFIFNDFYKEKLKKRLAESNVSCEFLKKITGIDIDNIELLLQKSKDYRFEVPNILGLEYNSEEMLGLEPEFIMIQREEFKNKLENYLKNE